MESIGWTDRVSKATVRGMEGLEQGFHALAPGVLDKGKAMGMHRTRQMIGMTGGWLVGNYIGNVMAGQDLNHHPIARDDVPLGLRFLHGSLSYNAFSDASHDRKLKVVHQLMGGLMGGVGAVAGSNSFFEASGLTKTIDDLMGKKAQDFHILDADKAASAAQASAWRPFAAMMGAFSSSSGMAMVLWLNFSTGINTVFNMMGNRKAGTELFAHSPLNKISNTPTSIPYGPSEVMPRMARYFGALGTAGANAEMTEEGERYVKALMKPLFPKMTEDEEKKILAKITRVREDTLEKHGDVQAKILEQFSGANFEALLRDVGLNPEEAKLGNHGLLTKISHGFSRFLGDVFGVEKKTLDIQEKLKEGIRLRAGEPHATASQGWSK